MNYKKTFWWRDMPATLRRDLECDDEASVIRGLKSTLFEMDDNQALYRARERFPHWPIFEDKLVELLLSYFLRYLEEGQDDPRRFWESIFNAFERTFAAREHAGHVLSQERGEKGDLSMLYMFSV